MQLQLLIDPLVNQLHCLSWQLGVPVVEDRLQYPPQIGKGYVQGYFFPNDLSLYHYQAEYLHPLQFNTINPSDSGVYCLFVTLSQEVLEKTINQEIHQLSRYSPESILYYAPGNSIFQQFEATGPQQFVVITFTRHTLTRLLSEAALKLVVPKNGGFLFMDLDLEAEKLALLLVEPGSELLAPLNRYGQTLSFLTRVFQKVLTRSTTKSTVGMLQPDIEQLFLARQHLLKRLAGAVSVRELAQVAGFSETKLKRLFPRLFGTSVHHYQQQARVEKAKELLASRRYSVSEVGYLVGYSNMTHFAKAFFRHHGVKPSQFLQAIKAGKELTSVSSVIP